MTEELPHEGPHIDKLIAAGLLWRRPDGKVAIPRANWHDCLEDGQYGWRGLIHFVGFKDDRYLTACKVWGKPDFVHRFWDRRAVDEIGPDDVVIFADGDEHQPVRHFAFDDSANF